MAALLKKAFCIVALVGLLFIGLASLYSAVQSEDAARLAQGSQETEQVLVDHAKGKKLLLAPGRLACSLLDLRYYPAVGAYLMDNGQYARTQERASMDEAVSEGKRLYDFCDGRGLGFLYVVLPCKPEDDSELLDMGLPCYRNANADEFVAEAQAAGVPVMDMRPDYRDDFYSWFYPTDHHWTSEAGLKAARLLAGELNDVCGYHFDLSRLDESRFSRYVAEDCFLGETASGTVGDFGQIDDFIIMKPGYEVRFHYTEPEQGIDRYGGFDAVLYEQRLHATMYYYYLGGNYSRGEIYNEDVQEGDILIIKDSFGNVMVPFFALCCKHVTLWDPRYDEGLLEYLESHPNIETVVVAVNAGSLIYDINHCFR